ncbi:MAG: serine/threonine protein kinase [Myxococcales bacterium]|nr:serine/threonine protein kinase [Myxococcales bacterium]
MANPPSDEPPSAPPADLAATPKLWSGVAVGDVLASRFRILAPISSGGTATVYRCEDLHLHAPAAVKVLTDATEDARLRFLDEGRILANLKSPHLVQVLAVGEVSPPVNSDKPAMPFMALELLPGRNLDQRLRQEGPLPWREAAELLGQVAGAVADMHQMGVIHRDIKPGNLVEIGSIARRRLVKVVDLGIAKVTDWTAVDTTGLTPSPRHQTEANFVVGTPGFIAPEARYVPANPRFDTFALGATLYLLCTGKMPDLADLRPMNEVRPECGAPQELEALIVSALTVVADERIATAEEFGARLASIRIAYGDASEPCLFAGCFELLQPLGVGAKGEVYKAYNHDAPSHVALKLLSEKSKANPEERARFAREAQVLKAVRHPALPEVYECRTSEKERRPYIAMSLAPGRRAGEFCIGKNILPPAEVLEVGRCIAGALATLHARGILHRDVNASNVLIDRVPKTTTATLIDVGMAELEDTFYAVVDQRYPPRPGERVKLGTGGLERLEWTAPEAKTSRVWTGKSDVWSLGFLLHKLLTGKRPVTNAEGVLVSPRELQPRCPDALASAVLSALNPDPDERVNAVQLLGLLEEATADELAEEIDPSPSANATAPRPTTSPPPRRRSAREWMRIGVEALAAAAILVLALRDGDSNVAAEPSPAPPSSGVTHAAVVPSSPAARSTPGPKRELLASSDVRKPMREALADAAEELRHCSDLAGGPLVVQFTTAEHGDKFADVAIHSRTSPAVDRCVGDATASLRFQPLAEPQRFTEEYP